MQDMLEFVRHPLFLSGVTLGFLGGVCASWFARRAS
jgi:hypothetical protein